MKPRPARTRAGRFAEPSAPANREDATKTIDGERHDEWRIIPSASAVELLDLAAPLTGRRPHPWRTVAVQAPLDGRLGRGARLDIAKKKSAPSRTTLRVTSTWAPSLMPASPSKVLRTTVLSCASNGQVVDTAGYVAWQH